MSSTLEQLSHRLIEAAKRAGAADADAIAVATTDESVAVRNGSIESIEREDSRGIGLRAFVEKAGGLAFASASTTDLSDAGLTRLAARVIEMARISEADPDAVPPTGADHPDSIPEPDSFELWSTEAAREAALACEAAALAHSEKITNSEGAHAGSSITEVAYAAADGFAGRYRKGSAGMSVSVIAGTGQMMQRDYAYDRVRHPAEMKNPETIGIEAAHRAAARLNPQSLSSRECPVIFEPRVATSLLGHLASAINGRAVLQGRTFLADAEGELVFPEWLSVIDDPDSDEGLGNRVFDGEGTRCARRTIIDSGRLTGFLTDRYAAGRLGSRPTGHARRGLTGDIGIGPSNISLNPGEKSVEALIREIGNGILVTELMGQGVNGVTGDYSRGAAGFLIENGEITIPVSEITIAGNLGAMFAGIRDLGSDLTWFGATAVPSVVLDRMTIAGQ